MMEENVTDPQYNLRHSPEIVRGKASDVFGLRLTDDDSGEIHTWWLSFAKLASMHGEVHESTNLGNEQLDDVAGIRRFTW